MTARRRIYRVPAGTQTHLKMSQKQLEVLGELLDIPPPLGALAGLEVSDFDYFFGSLFLVLHACYLF